MLSFFALGANGSNTASDTVTHTFFEVYGPHTFLGIISTLVGIVFFLIRHIINTYREYKEIQEHFREIEHKSNAEIHDLKTKYSDQLIAAYKDSSERLIEVVLENKEAIKDMRLSIDRNTDAQNTLKDLITMRIVSATRDDDIEKSS